MLERQRVMRFTRLCGAFLLLGVLGPGCNEASGPDASQWQSQSPKSEQGGTLGRQGKKTPILHPPASAAPPTTPGTPFDFARVFDSVSPSTVGVAAGHPRNRSFQVRQSGSGFAWDAHGHVVTNAHIVAEAGQIRIRTKDGRVLRAQLVGLDIGTDLAVLKVKALNLQPIPRAQASGVRPGQWVAAIGNPYGMDHSITVGVVSAIRRSNLPGGAPKYAEFIQSDASIFPGNSGGPLVNTHGQVIGLNTATLGGGLSFSTRIDMVETVTKRIIEDGRFERGFAGLYVKHVSHNAAESAGLERPRGARVRGLVQGGAAEAAGLKPGDIILKFNDREIEDSASLPWLIAATPPGETAQLSVARRMERLSLDLTMSRSPDSP